MKTKNVIFASLGVPALLFTAGFVFFRTHLEVPPLPGKFTIEEFSLFAEDSAVLPGTVYKPVGVPKSVVVVLPDRGLDRNWNPRGALFRTGAVAARILAGNGRAAFTYDQRGTGESAIPGRNYADFGTQTDDLLVVVRHAQKQYPGVPLEILGHGEGCVAAALAANTGKFPVRRLRLFSCAFWGSMLESWGERLLANMDRLNVKLELRSAARAEWRLILASHDASAFSGEWRTEEGKRLGKEPDLMSFQRAVRYLNEPEQTAWIKSARTLVFTSEIEKAAARMRVDHYIPEFDDQTSPGELDAVTKWSAGRARPGYTLSVLKHADFILKEQDRPAQGTFDLMVRRAGPLTPLAPDVVRVLAE
ncbi:MAG: alpha/beta hydrolase [Spirochaetia bacterium]|nr:alpha/beta hydrolase [Spirochaetia bacterium]